MQSDGYGKAVYEYVGYQKSSAGWLLPCYAN